MYIVSRRVQEQRRPIKYDIISSHSTSSCWKYTVHLYYMFPLSFRTLANTTNESPQTLRYISLASIYRNFSCRLRHKLYYYFRNIIFCALSIVWTNLLSLGRIQAIVFFTSSVVSIASVFRIYFKNISSLFAPICLSPFVTNHTISIGLFFSLLRMKTNELHFH